MLIKILVAAALVTLTATTIPAAAQAVSGTRLGLKAGACVAVLDGALNVDARPRTSLVMGPVVRFKPSKQGFGLQLEALLSSQGANYRTNTQTVKYDLHYLNFPLLLRQYIGPVFYVNVGPQVGLLLGNHSNLKKVDAAVVAGFGVELASGLLMDARLNYGVTDINNDPAERMFRQQLGLGGLHNRAAQFTVGYLFGQK